MLPLYARVCPYLPVSARISYLLVSPGISRYLPVSRHIPPYPAISRHIPPRIPRKKSSTPGIRRATKVHPQDAQRQLRPRRGRRHTAPTCTFLRESSNQFTVQFFSVLDLLLANQDTELTQDHSGRKAASRNSWGPCGGPPCPEAEVPFWDLAI